MYVKWKNGWLYFHLVGRRCRAAVRRRRSAPTIKSEHPQKYLSFQLKPARLEKLKDIE
jgi:hypothetical protein